MADWLGIWAFFSACTLLVIPTIAFLLVKDFSSQVAAQVLIAIFGNAFAVGLARQAMLYAPISLFGSYNGVVSSFLGCLQMVAFEPISRLADATLDGAERYTVPFSVMAANTLLAGLALLVFWTTRPPPTLGSVQLPAEY